MAETTLFFGFSSFLFGPHTQRTEKRPVRADRRRNAVTADASGSYSRHHEKSSEDSEIERDVQDLTRTQNEKRDSSAGGRTPENPGESIHTLTCATCSAGCQR
jgi:hypothetical protein